MRGGKRIGAGRPKVENKKVQIFFSVLPHLEKNAELKHKIKEIINNFENAK